MRTSSRERSVSARALHIVAAFSIASATAAAQAEQRLTVHLDSPYAYDALKSSVIHVVVANEGDEDVAIYEWDTPFVQSDGRMAKALFEVTDVDGNRVRYRGRHVNTARILADEFIVLRPGERREAEVDLRLEYEYGLGGAFGVRYALPLDRAPDKDAVTSKEYSAFRRNRQKVSDSNVTTIHIREPVVRTETADDGDCNDAQKELIRSARSKLFDPVYGAWNYMTARYVSDWGSDGALHNVFVPHARYTRWFGEQGADEPTPGDEGFANSNGGRAYVNVIRLFERMLQSGSNVATKCGCPGYPERTPAWTETNAPYVVHFCSRFFELQETGLPSSRVGTWIHEMSHFNDDAEGTADYVYGRQNAENLAKADRWRAVRNADNIEFFIVDTTPYDEREAAGVEA